MSRESIGNVFSIQGLLLLGTFLIGYSNNEIWLFSAFYISLPLFIIGTLVSFFSLFSKTTLAYRKQLRRFFVFNFCVLIGLLIFIWWAQGGTLIPAN